MDLGNGLGHLTYSTLVHPGDDWDQMAESLKTYLPKVKARVAPNEPFGVSLRLAAKSAQTLVDEPSKRDGLKRFLADNGMYLYTVNAFPYHRLRLPGDRMGAGAVAMTDDEQNTAVIPRQRARAALALAMARQVDH